MTDCCIYDRFFTYRQAAVTAREVAALCGCSIAVRAARQSYEVMVPARLYYSEWFLREVAEPDLIAITPQEPAHDSVH